MTAILKIVFVLVLGLVSVQYGTQTFIKEFCHKMKTGLPKLENRF